jgi:hypothetical protein
VEQLEDDFLQSSCDQGRPRQPRILYKYVLTETSGGGILSLLSQRIFHSAGRSPAGNEVDVARASAQATNDEGARVLDVTGVKVFSATKAKERELLGEVITDWMRTNQDRVDIVDKIVTQSSDSEFHCLTITLLYKHKA